MKSPFKAPALFIHHFRSIRALLKHSTYVLLVLNLLSVLCESFGILLFIPLFSLLSQDAGAHPIWLGELPSFIGVAQFNLDLSSALLLFVAAFVLKGLLVFLIFLYQRRVLADIRFKLRKQLLSHCSKLDYLAASQTSIGRYTNLAIRDVDQAVIGADYYTRLCTSLLAVAIFVTWAMVIDIRLSLLIIAATLFNFILLQGCIRLANHYALREQQIMGSLYEFLIRTLSAFRYLKSTNRFEILQSQIDKTNEACADTQKRLGLSYAATIALGEPLLVILLAFVIYYHVAIQGNPFATLVASLVLFYRSMSESNAVIAHWHTVTECSGGLDSISKALGDFSSQTERSGTRVVRGISSGLVIADVSFGYGKGAILENISLRIPSNSSFAIVGRSGAGKSTLIDILTGILKPDSGALYVDGVDATLIDLGSYRSLLGLVSQDPVVFNDTIAANISMRFDGTIEADELRRVAEVCELCQCHEFIEQLPEGVHTLIGEGGARLSGGQLQRIAIARELFRRPKILILDEPTSALDLETERLLKESIMALRRKITLIVISHRSSFVEGVDTIVFLEAGRIVRTIQRTEGESSDRFPCGDEDASVQKLVGS